MAKQLSEKFKPTKYRLKISGEICQLTIDGRKLPPPSQRITLHQKNLKILSAEIIYITSKEPVIHGVVRINHLPTFQQVRLHTSTKLFPGNYQIKLTYRPSPGTIPQLQKLGDQKPDRNLVPSVDEPEAWAQASFEIKS